MNVDQLRLGCIVGPPDPRNLQAARILDVAKLPTPPAAWTKISQRVKTWPVYANDRLNDCTTACVGHRIIAASGWAGHLVVPTEQSIVDLYWATGKADNGRVPNAVLSAWRQATGPLAAHRPEAYVEVDRTDAAMLRSAGFLFGGLYFCAELPANLKTQLAANAKTWRYVAGTGSAPGSWGGHAFAGVGFYANGDWDIRSWGTRFRVTKRFIQEYVYLVFAILSKDELQHVNQKSPGGLDLATLSADLAAVSSVAT